MTCINCGNEVNGKFCSSCGQRTDVKRITLKEGWNDFWARIYGFDGMFPRTIRDLTLHPGQVAQKYINGNRALYYGPVGYFFLMITLFVLYSSSINVSIQEFLDQRVLAPVQSGTKGERMLESILNFVAENMKVFVFFIMPFYAVAARYLLFRKSGLNFLEHMVQSFYGLGHLYWLSIISVTIYKLTGSFFFSFISLVLTPLYFGFAYAELFAHQSKTRLFIKGFMVPFLAQVLISLTTILIVTLLVLTIPDFRESINTK